MKLRELEMKDAPLMLEWMHDPDVISGLKRDFLSKTLEDCEAFIRDSWNTEENLHLAIADGRDHYIGTVSLKNINWDRKCAEFAIAIRRCAMGKGYSGFAMRELIRIGWEEKHLDMIYWNVKRDNLRAIQFYKKGRYERLSETLKLPGGGQKHLPDFSGIWQRIPKNDNQKLFKKNNSAAACIAPGPGVL